METRTRPACRRLGAWPRRGSYGAAGATGGIVLFLVLALATHAPTARAAGPLAGHTVVVDPGHGGADPGAMAFGFEEKAITLRVGLDLGSLLRRQGARVVYTRTSDATVGPAGDQLAGLVARAAVANRDGADVFVSLHVNSLADPSYDGLMTFYGSPSGYVTGIHRPAELTDESRRLAEAVHAAVLRRSGERDRGVRDADYVVLGATSMPSILVELGFITNGAEARRLAAPGFDWTLAQGIADGLAAYVAQGARGVTNGRLASRTAAASTPVASAPHRNDARYVADASYPDHTVVALGASVLKAWTVTNTGSASWRGDRLVAKPGPGVRTAPSVPLPPVAPGATAQISVPVTVPTRPGTATATWLFETSTGQTFGDVLTLVVDVRAPAFRPYWVVATAAAPLRSGPVEPSAVFGTVPPGTRLLVVSPPSGRRLFVRYPATGGVAYVDAARVAKAASTPWLKQVCI